VIEVEIRSRIKNIDFLRESLKKTGASFIENKKQIDKVFGSPIFLDENTKVIEGGLSARIRQVDDKIQLEFKEIVREGGGLEVEAGLDRMEDGISFLNKLNFTEAFTISKTREIYSYKDFLISVDRVDGLGDFIEVEKMVQNQGEISKARGECLGLLKQLAPDFEIVNEKYGDLMQNIINNKKNGK